MVVRCTKRMLDLLGGREVVLGEFPPTDDDWYLNLLWIDRQKCLLLTHAGTLFSVFRVGIRSADLRPIGNYLVAAIETELRAESLPVDAFAELQPDGVRLTKTASRHRLPEAGRPRTFPSFGSYPLNGSVSVCEPYAHVSRAPAWRNRIACLTRRERNQRRCTGVGLLEADEDRRSDPGGGCRRPCRANGSLGIVGADTDR